MNKRRNVTIQTVADIAGVSKSTVSRAISNYPDISESTKKKIFDVMEDLNYYPSAIARSLANRISKNVGLVLPSDDDFFFNPFFQESLRAIAKTASSRGYDTLLAYNGNNETLSVERLVKANKVDGVIMMRSIVNDPTIEYLRKNNFPFVLIGKSIDFNDILSIDTDNVKASKELTQILIDNGCKKVGFIGGDKNSVVTIDRYEGFINAIEQSDIPLDDSLVQENEFNMMNGYSSIEKILKNNPDLDGVIITDALIFSGAMEFFEEKRLVGDFFKDRTIYIGTFGVAPYRKIEGIEVINVDVNSMELGRASCEKLIDVLEGKAVNQIDIIDYKFR